MASLEWFPCGQVAANERQFALTLGMQAGKAAEPWMCPGSLVGQSEVRGEHRAVPDP